MRILFAVGCNSYDHAQPLSEAELDARRMYECLTRPEVGDYSTEHSVLLLSPTLAELRAALQQVLFGMASIETFTFFFAGHGTIHAGSFYMALRDSRTDLLSLSAFSLSELFRSLNEKQPGQSNVIMDACEGGGLIADLGTLLKNDMLGDAGTPSITLVATSAQDEEAGEAVVGGVGTNAILDCIEGREVVQDYAPVLDLVEIGRSVSTRLRATGQSPVVWGLNLSGPPGFCKNPSFGSDPGRRLRDVIRASSNGSANSLSDHYDALWSAYTSVSGSWRPRNFAKVIEAAFAALDCEPDELAAFSRRFGAAVMERAIASDDPFRQAQVVATLGVCLLPYCEHEGASRTAQQILESAAITLLAAGTQLVADLTTNRDALLTQGAFGLPDLFYLPIRVSKVLGWLAALPDMYPTGDSRRAEAEALFCATLRQLLAEYSGAIVTMSEIQAPYWLATTARALRLQLFDETESLIGLLFHSFVECKGQLARFDIPPEDVLGYLLARQTKNFVHSADLVERPGESLTLLLKVAHLLKLNEVIDDDLWRLDGEHLCAYLNGDFSQFGKEIMAGGQNAVWKIGEDIFRVEHIVSAWPASAPQAPPALIASLDIVASLLYPDRMPWFLLDNIAGLP